MKASAWRRPDTAPKPEPPRAAAAHHAPHALLAAAQAATTTLRLRFPSLSAASPASVGQIVTSATLGFALAGGLFIAPAQTVTLLHALALAGFTLLALVRLVAAFTPLPRFVAPVAPSSVPFWTILIALHDEAEVVAGLIGAINRLDWPRDRLEIMLLVEQGDQATHAALIRLGLRAPYQIILVPPGQPRTKPRALNVGLALARGSFITVYDAEDRPNPGQLRAAWAALNNPDRPRIACAQAPLVIHNGREGWLTAQFALEYAIHFYVLVPAFVRFGWPVPLGGTSNHFRADVLRAVGGWDPFNVTEDADLGVRLARSGWRTGFIAPPTLEEAPPQLGSWLRQRSRWLKGHAQTLGVHTRHPFDTMREIGVWPTFGLLITLGGTVVSAMVHAPLAIAAIAATAMGVLPQEDAVVLLLGVGSSWAAALLAAWRTQRADLLIAALTMPLYWPFQTLAALRALHGLVTNPFAWDKTAHGRAARR